MHFMSRIFFQGLLFVGTEKNPDADGRYHKLIKSYGSIKETDRYLNMESGKH